MYTTNSVTQKTTQIYSWVECSTSLIIPVCTLNCLRTLEQIVTSFFKDERALQWDNNAKVIFSSKGEYNWPIFLFISLAISVYFSNCSRKGTLHHIGHLLKNFCQEFLMREILKCLAIFQFWHSVRLDQSMLWMISRHLKDSARPKQQNRADTLWVDKKKRAVCTWWKYLQRGGGNF